MISLGLNKTQSAACQDTSVLVLPESRGEDRQGREGSCSSTVGHQGLTKSPLVKFSGLNSGKLNIVFKNFPKREQPRDV